MSDKFKAGQIVNYEYLWSRLVGAGNTRLTSKNFKKTIAMHRIRARRKFSISLIVVWVFAAPSFTPNSYIDVE